MTASRNMIGSVPPPQLSVFTTCREDRSSFQEKEGIIILLVFRSKASM